MGAGELLLNVGQRCLSFSALAALVRTLALTHVALSEHSNSYRHVKVAWFSRSSNRRKSARQSLKQDVSQPTAVSSANGCYEIDWKSRIVAVTDDFVVLDKPAGTTVGGTTDNIEESCATFATRALGLTTPLMTTHQVDNCTEGCVVLARTKEYCSVFHGKIREKKVKKHYLALAAAPVPIGTIIHYMRPINMAPRLISEGNSLCQALHRN
ncbi:unnamed protein product [Malus baccata var. baccata]